MTSLPDAGFQHPTWFDTSNIHEVELQLKEMGVPRAEDVSPVTDEVRERTIGVLAALASNHHILAPAIVPGFDGSVNLEWHLGGMEFDISIEPAAPTQAYIFDPASGEEWDGPYTEVETDKILARFADAS